MPAESQITQLLQEWRAGDAAAYERVLDHVYSELNRLARDHMRRERSAHTLQPTALVHEALLRLQSSNTDFQSRAHFYGAASRTMRRVLVDHARAAKRDKRGGDAVHVTLDADVHGGGGMGLDILDVDRAIDKLIALDARKADMIELHYFGGLTIDGVAECLEISIRTVHRDMRLAKAWLRRELSTA